MFEAEEIFDDASRDCDLDAVCIVSVDERDHTDVVVGIEDDFSQTPWNCTAMEYHLIVTRTHGKSSVSVPSTRKCKQLTSCPWNEDLIQPIPYPPMEVKVSLGVPYIMLCAVVISVNTELGTTL